LTGEEGNLQDEVMIGREQKTKRKTQMTWGFRCFFWEREIGGGGCGGGVAYVNLSSPIG